MYYNSFPQMYAPPVSRQEITRVNGENGAKAFQMAPNSSVLLLDESAPLVWLKQTDGAGYPSLTPYEIKPYTIPTTTSSLEERVKKLEEMFNAKPDTTETAPSKSK